MRDRFLDSAGSVSVITVLAFALYYANDSLAAVSPDGPAAINAGPFAITPGAGVEVKHRDNIYLQQNNGTDSWIYLARPTLNVLAQDRENTYQLNYQGEAARYQVSRHNDDNDYFDNTISGDAHLEFSERLIAEGFISWAALHEDRGTGLSEGLIGEVLPKPIEYDQGDVAGSLQFGSEKDVGWLLVKAGYMERQYQNFKELTRPRDRDEAMVDTTFFYPVAPNTDILAEYTFKRIHYPNPFDEVAQLDSDENSLSLGAQWEITPNLTSTAKASYIDKDFKDSAREDWDGLGWTLELLMQPREQDTILVTSTRHPEETTLQGNFIKRDVLTATWTHQWSDRVYSELGSLLGQDSYAQSFDNREDDIFNTSLKVGYEFRRWINVYTGYAYDRKNSNVENLSYRDYVFNIGVELSL
ncbi:MAG: outer membrane beta-barrel protein [Halioglobus sp.]|nr:outer membrane beta-barrel protein [Halioglobus sp.]